MSTPMHSGKGESQGVATRASPAVRPILHQLRPLAIGTPFCESAYSYVNRLAQSHRVTLLRLVRFVCEPRPGLFENKISVPDRLDSQCATAAEFVARLSVLTDLPEVQLIGLSWLHGRVAENEPIKPLIPWCPKCLRSARNQKQDVYGQTAWLFINNRICVVHGLPLVDRCPRCGFAKSSRTSTKAVPLDACTHCGCDLADEDLYSAQALRGDSSSWERWAALQIADLIAEAPKVLESRSAPDFARIARSAIERGRVRSVKELLKRAGVGSSYGRICKLTTLPSVDLLLRLSIAADVSIAGVLAPTYWADDRLGVTAQEATAESQRRLNRARDWDAIAARVRRGLEADEPISIKALAAEQEMQPAHLLSKLGPLGHWVTRQKREREARELQGHVDELAERIAELHLTHSYFGRRLSISEVGRAFSIPRGSGVLRLAWQKFTERGNCARQEGSLFSR